MQTLTYKKLKQKFIDILKKKFIIHEMDVQGGSNMTGTNCDLFIHK
jgi:hypothetical protein